METQRLIALVIPVLNPDERLLLLLKGLRDAGWTDHIVVVNDGSRDDTYAYFEAAEQNFHCTVLRHHVNLGKGRALKTAFNYVLNEWPECAGVVTLDADGQHSVKDITACAAALLEHPDTLVMGCRNFNGPGIPTRSRMGNKLTCRVLRWLCGIRVSDTQTGLRGISCRHMELFMNTHGERFEYEMNMLVDTKEHSIPITEVEIDTIYGDNHTSHFNPLLDSFRIYKVFLGFIVTSLSSFVIDITLFSILIYFLKPLLPATYIYVSTVGARVVSSVFNFFVNKNGVFRGGERNISCLIKYFILAVIQLFLSAFGVKYLFIALQIPEPVLKIPVDVILFLISFYVQREWVFRNRSGGTQP